jgi:glycerophosphoryl diester phosphodiesterase
MLEVGKGGLPPLKQNVTSSPGPNRQSPVGLKGNKLIDQFDALWRSPTRNAVNRMARPFSTHKFVLPWLVALVLFFTSQTSLPMTGQTSSSVKKPLLVAHRGASGYSPEHTIAAYQLAIEQGADFVEQDLQVTKDGVLICLHDADLGRTTNVSELFPDRQTTRDPLGAGTPKPGWYAVDFTLAEIKRLDAGSWFNRANPFAASPAFVALRIPTMEEAIKLVGNRAGLYIELKYFSFYKSLGFDSALLLAEVLKKQGFERPTQRDRIFIQCFYKEGLLRMKEVAPGYARVQLLPMETLGREKDTAIITPMLAAEVAAYAKGVGPSKSLLKSADDVATFHKAGLVIHPYTFRGSTSANARRPLDEVQSDGSTLRANVIADIQRFVGLGIDGGFTDYPELWKQAVAAGSGRKK